VRCRVGLWIRMARVWATRRTVGMKGWWKPGMRMRGVGERGAWRFPCKGRAMRTLSVVVRSHPRREQGKDAQPQNDDRRHNSKVKSIPLHQLPTQNPHASIDYPKRQGRGVYKNSASKESNKESLMTGTPHPQMYICLLIPIQSIPHHPSSLIAFPTLSR